MFRVHLVLVRITFKVIISNHTSVVAHTTVVKPHTTLHAGCGKAGEVKVYSTTGTVRIVWKK